MSAIVQASRPAALNRRRRVRQKVHAPAYASFRNVSQGETIALHEVLDLSEVGVALQCSSQLEINKQVDLCLDLAESSGQISCPARVVWSDAGGRTGLALPPLNNAALHRLRQWLFLNAMAGAANAAAGEGLRPPASMHELRPTYTDRLNAASAVQREAESLASDLEAVLALVVSRSQSLLRASGAAIALLGKEGDEMICWASAGECAPPVGVSLHAGSGFSGECVRTGTSLRCDDAETDLRVDRESSQALGIRSILAVPIKCGEKVMGLLEVFSPEPTAFTDKDSAVLQRFAETIADAADRAAKKNASSTTPPSARAFTPPPGSVLFAHVPSEETGKEKASHGEDRDKAGGIRLPRAHLYLLICAAAAIFLALGFVTAPWIQPWLQGRLQARPHGDEATVLASSKPATETTKPAAKLPSVDSAGLEQLQRMAESGDAAAEDRLGRLYAEGDEKLGIVPNDREAAHWFTSAAEHGSVSAQYKLGLLYWGGHHGLPKDVNQAYFWTVLARAGGQEGSKDLATFLANSMTRAQAAAIEQQAEMWYRQHEPNAKPSAGH